MTQQKIEEVEKLLKEVLGEDKTWEYRKCYGIGDGTIHWCLETPTSRSQGLTVSHLSVLHGFCNHYDIRETTFVNLIEQAPTIIYDLIEEVKTLRLLLKRVTEERDALESITNSAGGKI